MRKIGLLLGFFICICGNMFSQVYGGVGNLKITGTGVNASTILETNSAGSSINIGNHSLICGVKTSTFDDLASITGKAILLDVFNYQSNRLLKFEIDANNINPSFGSSFTNTSVAVPCTITYAGHTVQTTAIMNIDFQANNKAIYSLSMNVDIQNLGLSLGTHSADFSSIITISLDNITLNKK